MKDKNRLRFNQGVGIIVGHMLFISLMIWSMVFFEVELIQAVIMSSIITSIFGFTYVIVFGVKLVASSK